MKFWPAAKAGGAKPEHAVLSCISYMKARMLRFRSAHLRRRPKFHFGTPFFHIKTLKRFPIFPGMTFGTFIFGNRLNIIKISASLYC
ncbi:MAG: hypothetical protein GY795_36705 [Desulfobacterales bacterium]|nr:hypothetical protein [Desulfobacterales bacterium]